MGGVWPILEWQTAFEKMHRGGGSQKYTQARLSLHSL
jgi:hypothetical protein